MRGIGVSFLKIVTVGCAFSFGRSPAGRPSSGLPSGRSSLRFRLPTLPFTPLSLRSLSGGHPPSWLTRLTATTGNSAAKHCQRSLSLQCTEPVEVSKGRALPKRFDKLSDHIQRNRDVVTSDGRRKGVRVQSYSKWLVLLFCLFSFVNADEVWSHTDKANGLLKKGKADQAVVEYDAALKKSPADQKLLFNKATGLYRQKKYEEAVAGFEAAAQSSDTALAHRARYNAGNACYKSGENLAGSQDPQETQKAQAAFKKAAEHYSSVLSATPKDTDAKWNLEMAVKRMKEMEQKNKDQQKNNDDKNKQDQNKDKNDQNNDKKDSKDGDDKNDQNQDKNDKNKDQDKKNQDEQKKEGDQKKDQDKQNPSQNDPKKDPGSKKPEENKPQPTPQEKQAAEQLLMQYADEARDLNKPPKQVKAVPAGRPEKDW